MLKHFLLICSIGILAGLELLPEMPVLEYYNRKYIQFAKVTAGRQSRRSPYYINLHIKTLSGIGDNLTVSLAVFEFLSGRYHPTPIQMKGKVCDFFYNEPFIGQMLAKQIPFNWTCPFPAGEYKFNKFIIHTEKFPYNIPFISTSVTVKTRLHGEGRHTDTGELIYKGYMQMTIIQKPKIKWEQD